MVASASAMRVAAMRWSGEAGRSAARSTRAASTKNRATPSGPGWRNTWSYQPGLRTPAPYPVDDASRSWVHGTQLTATFTFGSPRRVAASAPAGRDVTSSAGTCHAPHTTTIWSWPALTAARIALRMWPRGAPPTATDGAVAHRGHRLGHRGERRQPVAAVLDDVVPPALGVGLAGRCGELAERVDRCVADDQPVVRR
jgi:hypothetical protein